ncbi:sialidase family protein [Streptomyces sp. H27-D2]|uniref:sialidase family protein n=1 Tax=Streptomyces sp. H27-D2 TaxID=3046304 RepID=UPI002DBF623C|nr:sialidase family protein [Streptomyces sp. H27-D2]MEC4018716.1 sialidase family protein [Streptomyces sp. H27-D2]
MALDLRAPVRRWRRGVVLAAAAALALLPARTGFEQRVLFKAASEQGYACFRIPAIVESVRGTLLAFAEGRVDNCGDAGDIDLVLKRSADGGRTWGPLQVVDEGRGDTHGNPAPLVDRRTGRILLASTYNRGRDDAQNCDVPCDRMPHLQYSDDDGAGWSAPRDLTDSIRPADWNSWYATGPLHGIQLTRGPRAGRLVFGVNAESYEGSRITANHAALVHSDDGGRDWRVGAVDTHLVAPDGTFRQKPSEMALTERSDGSVYVNGREQDGTDLGHRDHAVSHDGGQTFTAPFQAIPDLYTPMVQGSLLRLPGRMLFAAPADPDRRRTMTIRSSYDQGRTWESVDRGRTVTADWSGYSDMAAISTGAGDSGSAAPDEPGAGGTAAHGGTVGLLYEGGAVDARDEIRFARFTGDWLGPRRGPDPTTDDRTPGARDGLVLGGPVATSGRFGRALEFDGADDAVRLPHRSSLPLGSRDFTASLWFRYSAEGGEQPFLWMGGVGSKNPQVWLRGDPTGRRVMGLITTLDGGSPAASASVRTDRAYNDGQWHHAALRRGGGQLTLTVDGVSVSTPDVPGSVSRNSTFGVHVGQKPDSRAHLSGALDEVRVYDRALSDAELDRLRERDMATGRPVLSLPLDRVRPAG